MKNHYRDYLIQKCGYEGSFDHEHGMILYRFYRDENGRPVELRIGEIHVDPDYRQKGIAKSLADKCTALAREYGCKYMSCATHITGNDDSLSMLAILHYGFKPVKANSDEIIFLKDIGENNG